MTNTGSDVWGEGIATSGTTVHLIYGTGVVMYRSSADEGATRSNAKQIGSGTIHLTDPIWADGNDVWVIYLGDIQNETDWCCSRDLGNIYLLHSGNNGQTWDAPKKLTTAAQAYRVSMTFDAGKLHIVWMDFRSNAWDVYYLRSSDRGATWDAAKRIAISAGTFGACMAGPTFSFNVCPDTWYIASYDGGTTWGSEVNVANSGAAIAGRNDIAVAGIKSVRGEQRRQQSARVHDPLARRRQGLGGARPAHEYTRPGRSRIDRRIRIERVPGAARQPARSRPPRAPAGTRWSSPRPTRRWMHRRLSMP